MILLFVTYELNGTTKYINFWRIDSKDQNKDKSYHIK